MTVRTRPVADRLAFRGRLELAKACEQFGRALAALHAGNMGLTRGRLRNFVGRVRLATDVGELLVSSRLGPPRLLGADGPSGSLAVGRLHTGFNYLGWALAALHDGRWVAAESYWRRWEDNARIATGHAETARWIGPRARW